MAVWTAAARQAANLSRLSSPKTASTAQAASLIHRRGLAGGGVADHHGTPKFVIVSLTGCGLLFYGGYEFFIKGKNDKKEEKVGEQSGPSH